MAEKEDVGNDEKDMVTSEVGEEDLKGDGGDEELPPTIEERLMEKFHLKDIEWVIVNAFDFKTSNGIMKKAFAMPYIKKESAERRADKVLGPFNWENDYAMPDGAGRFKYLLKIRESHGSDWIKKHSGGSISQSAGGQLSDNAFESALSFAEKRAWAKIGIGRYLKLVPQIEVQTSDDWQEGWSKYRFKSKVDKNETVSFYWRDPQLPEWALHPEDEYNDQGSNTEPPPPPDKDKMTKAGKGHWKVIMAYYNNIPDEQKVQWDNYLFVDEVDDDTGEVTGTRQREISVATAKKFIASMETGYGHLTDKGIPEKYAEPKPEPEEDLSPEDQEIKDLRDSANEKK